MSDPKSLTDKIKAQPLPEVEDSVDSIAAQTRALSLAAAAGASAPAFADVWNNPEDDVYDA